MLSTWPPQVSTVEREVSIRVGVVCSVPARCGVSDLITEQQILSTLPGTGRLDNKIREYYNYYYTTIRSAQALPPLLSVSKLYTPIVCRSANRDLDNNTVTLCRIMRPKINGLNFSSLVRIECKVLQSIYPPQEFWCFICLKVVISQPEVGLRVLSGRFFAQFKSRLKQSQRLDGETWWMFHAKSSWLGSLERERIFLLDVTNRLVKMRPIDRRQHSVIFPALKHTLY